MHFIGTIAKTVAVFPTGREVIKFCPDFIQILEGPAISEKQTRPDQFAVHIP